MRLNIHFSTEQTKNTFIMAKKLFTISMLLFSLTAFSQVSDSIIGQLKKEMWILKVEMRSQRADFSSQLAAQDEIINSLRAELATERENLAALAESLGVQVTKAQTNADQIQGVQQKMSQNTLYWIIIALIIALLSVILFVLLRKRLQSDKTDMAEQLSYAKIDMVEQLSDTKTDVIGQLSNTKTDMIRQLSQTKSSIEENLAKEFGKQTEIIDEAIELIKKQKEKAKPAGKKKTKQQAEETKPE